MMPEVSAVVTAEGQPGNSICPSVSVSCPHPSMGWTSMGSLSLFSKRMRNKYKNLMLFHCSFVVAKVPSPAWSPVVSAMAEGTWSHSQTRMLRLSGWKQWASRQVLEPRLEPAPVCPLPVLTPHACLPSTPLPVLPTEAARSHTQWACRKQQHVACSGQWRLPVPGGDAGQCCPWENYGSS